MEAVSGKIMLPARRRLATGVTGRQPPARCLSLGALLGMVPPG